MFVALVMLVALVVPAISTATVQPSFVVEADAYESDDSTTTAKPLVPVSMHTFHKDDDDDYMKFSVAATGTVYSFDISAPDLGNDHDMYIHVVDATGADAGNTIGDDYNDDGEFDTYDSQIVWGAPAPGTYYVWVEPRSSDRGTYTLYANQGYGRRISGANRFETAVMVSKLMFSGAGNADYDDGPAYCVVANGMGYADALAGGVLASYDDGPLLLTEATRLPSVTKDEINRISAHEYWDGNEFVVYILGGPAVVSSSVMAEIKAMPHVSDVVRISGADRYETAAAAMEQADDDYGLSSTAYVVSGEAWADALAAGPVAAWDEGPLLLTMKSSVPQVTKDFINDYGITNIVVVGGTSVIDSTAYGVLESLVATTTDIIRISGANRYETARKVAQHGVDEVGMDATCMTLCSGENYPDALAAAPISWWTDGPMLLTGGSSLNMEVKKFVDDNGPMGDSAVPSYLIGGPAVVSDAVLNAWRMYY